jgi:polar amino acid transport system substrate-binding protein
MYFPLRFAGRNPIRFGYEWRGGFMKNSRFLVLTACLAAFLLPAGPAYAARVLTVEVSAGRPPMVMKDAKGRLTGFEIELLRAIAEEAGFRMKIRDVPWTRLARDLEAGKCDAVMASFPITEQRKERFDFSAPYYMARSVLVVRKDRPAGPFEGKEVASFRMSAGADLFRKSHVCKIAVYTLDELDQALTDLATGNLEGILCDFPLSMGFVKGKYKNELMLADDALSAAADLPGEDYGVAVRKGDAATLHLINKGLLSVKDKGLDSRLREKWLK